MGMVVKAVSTRIETPLTCQPDTFKATCSCCAVQSDRGRLQWVLLRALLQGNWSSSVRAYSFCKGCRRMLLELLPGPSKTRVGATSGYHQRQLSYVI